MEMLAFLEETSIICFPNPFEQGTRKQQNVEQLSQKSKHHSKTCHQKSITLSGLFDNQKHA
jgi:hypothetical protein